MAPENSSDFDPKEFSATKEKHGKDIQELSERVAKVEAQLSSPQQFAEFFKKNTEDYRVMENILADAFCKAVKEKDSSTEKAIIEIITKNDAVRSAVLAQVRDNDRSMVFMQLKRWWIWIFGIGIILADRILGELAKWVISFIPHH